ncbi:unnamed protein product [Scytosiphon promiscuus]
MSFNRRRALFFGLCCAIIAVPLYLQLHVRGNAKPHLEETQVGHESAIDPVEYRNSTPPLFSKEWEENYGSGHVGCDLGRKRYYWRPCGFGSNIVHLLNAFVYAIAVQKWSDVAVMSPPGALDALRCTGDFGISVQGYYCLFKPMPHVCTFGREKEWLEFMRSKKVPEDDFKKAPSLHWQMVRSRATWAAQEEALAEHGVDTFGALAVMARYFWNNLSPWLEEDVRKALDRPEVDIFRKQPYVGLHIRRGDKVAEGEAAKVETHKYLEAALKYYKDRSARDAEGIKAVWVASDDKDAVKEVRAIVRDYFPNVADKDVLWVSGANAGGKVATHSTSEAYEGFVMVFADLKMLSAARVFVGTYSSNVGRLVALLREGVDGYVRESCISLDKTTYGLEY